MFKELYSKKRIIIFASYFLVSLPNCCSMLPIHLWERSSSSSQTSPQFNSKIRIVPMILLCSIEPWSCANLPVLIIIIT